MYLAEEEFKVLAGKYGIQLSELEMKSRSLLNRNAIKQWKFSISLLWSIFLAKRIHGDVRAYFQADFEG